MLLRKKNRLPLMIAARYNNVEVIQYLVSRETGCKKRVRFNAVSYARPSNATDGSCLFVSVTIKCAVK
jgi:hypothetical protein